MSTPSIPPLDSIHSLKQLATVSATRNVLARVPAFEIYQGIAIFLEKIVSMPLKDHSFKKISRLTLRSGKGVNFEICLMPDLAQRVIVMMKTDHQALSVEESRIQDLK